MCLLPRCWIIPSGVLQQYFKLDCSSIKGLHDLSLNRCKTGWILSFILNWCFSTKGISISNYLLIFIDCLVYYITLDCKSKNIVLVAIILCKFYMEVYSVHVILDYKVLFKMQPIQVFRGQQFIFLKLFIASKVMVILSLIFLFRERLVTKLLLKVFYRCNSFFSQGVSLVRT